MRSSTLTWRVRDSRQHPRIQRCAWTDRNFAAAGFWVDDCVAIGSRSELTALAKSVDGKDGITGLGEVRMGTRQRDHSARTISISQEAFIDSILARVNLTDATTVAAPLTPGTRIIRLPRSKDVPYLPNFPDFRMYFNCFLVCSLFIVLY
jgi:hypothetical protein